MLTKIMLAMSGGVDSSAALILLKDKYEIIGATMNLFDGESSAIADARKTAESFNIPHHVCDLKEQFKNIVTESFMRSYINGETPNPCVVCNRFIKFGEFLNFARESLGCEYMATGHYARVEYDKGSGRYLLKKANSKKDQSYVLYGLTQEQLSRVIFPLGNLDKEQVRAIAQEHGLVNYGKPDSQDICFIPDGDYAGYIVKHSGITPESGEICAHDGRILGRHTGIIKYTIGQRKGLGLVSENPLYVTGKDAVNNRVFVGGNAELYNNSLTARELNWIAFSELKSDMRLFARTRYSQPEQPCTVTPIDENNVKVIFDSPQRAITPGQSVVFYDGDIIIGGGVIA